MKSPTRGARLLGYAIAAGGAAAVIALQRLAAAHLSSGVQWLLLLAGTVAAAWFGGAGPALAATLLGVAAGLARPALAGAPSSGVASLAETLIFAALGGGVAFVALQCCCMRRRILEECGRLTLDLRDKEERYRAFITNSSEPTFLFEAAEPIPVTLPEDEQIAWIYRTAYLAECNQAMATLYGYASPSEMLGTRLEVLMPPTEERNIELLRRFIRSDYRLTDVESREVDRSGNWMILLNNLAGVVENGFLVRGWGTSRDVTRQRQAEEALRLSEERFRLSAQAVCAIIYEWNVPTDHVVRSAGFFEVLGYTPEESDPTGRWWNQIIHPEDRPLLKKFAAAIEQGTDYFSTEYRVRHRDGRWVHLWDRGLVIRDETGRASKIYGSSLDITAIVEARRRMEEMAEAAELHFRQLEGVLQSMGEGVTVFTAAGHLISMNAAMMRMHGFEADENMQFCARELADRFEVRLPDGTPLGLEDRPAIRALRGEEVSGFELEVRRKGQGGEFRTFSYNATPVRNHEGKIVLAVVTARDITEQKRAEKALRQSELHYRTLADTVPCIVYTTTPPDGIDYCNRLWYEYTGFTVEQTLGYGALSAIHPDDRKAVLSDWSDALLENRPFTREYRIRRHDGEYRWFLGRAVSLRNQAGKVVKWFGTSIEIEDRKRAEAEIRLANEQLAATRDEAIEANRAKSVFLANMSHELRTPLTAILGYAEMLEEDARESGREDQARDLGNIISAGHHLLTLINELLDLAKVEAGRMHLNSGEFDIAQLVCETTETALPLARINSNELAVSCPADIGVMVADRVKVRQALINLLSNACKFTERGRIELTVTRLCLEGHDWVEFRVTDTGIGIEADQLDLIFREFVQVDSGAGRKHGGTGLGLAITRRFCQMMGGSVTAESEPGRGSTFFMRLPATPLHSEERPEAV